MLFEWKVMNFYPFHIGDYISHTSHLSDIEDLAYRRMIDLYYQTEQPFNDSSTVARKIKSTVEIVELLLNEFFELDSNNLWRNKRADEEIAKYHGKIEQAIKAGKASAQQRLNKRSTSVQPTNNQEPITNNHKPINKAPKVASPAGVSESLWKDFLKVRKEKKLAITETALKGIEREAKLANKSMSEVLQICCENGWGGFKASWLTNLSNPIEKKKQANWWLTDESVLAKGRELGINARAGESMGQYKQRIQQELDRV